MVLILNKRYYFEIYIISMNHRTNKDAKIPNRSLGIFFLPKTKYERGMKYVSIQKQPLCHQKCCGRRANATQLFLWSLIDDQVQNGNALDYFQKFELKATEKGQAIPA